MNRRRALVLGAVVLVAIVVVAAVAFWPRGTTEISQEQALDDFRERAAATTLASHEHDLLPEPGVYTYSAVGAEDVKLGPLPAENRPLPPTVTAVVLATGDGCFEWSLNLFAEHTETTRWCAGPDELRLAAHSKHQRIGAMSPTATMSCDPASVRAPDTDTQTIECDLDLDGGPASVSATLDGAATTGPTETIIVDGTEVRTIPIKVDYVIGGDLSGSWTETTWWSETNLPIRVERQLDLRGLATFSETSRLDLVDLQPAR